MTDADLAAHARDIIRANLYLTLGTADRDGRPWTSPVYFAPGGDGEFYWSSEVGAVHSRHLAGRPQVSLVVFDSTVAPYHGRAVYAAGEAREVPEEDVEEVLSVYPRPGGAGTAFLAPSDVTGASAYRIYRATATELWVLCPRDPGEPCGLHGLAKDHRAQVTGFQAF